MYKDNQRFPLILEKNQFDTFYHEHPRTYSARSFEFIAKKLDANLIKSELPSRYGGNIRIFISKSLPPFEIRGFEEDNFVYLFEQMQNIYLSWLENSKIEIK